jgi:anti-sigma regulatory factor (Ser/Thr protein kinase)
MSDGEARDSTFGPLGGRTDRIPGEVPDNLEVDQSFGVEGLQRLRSTVAAHSSHHQASGVAEALVIVAGELATNAVRHGGGVGRLRLWQDDEYLYVQITDNGPGIANPAVGLVRPEPQQDGGRGLWIVRRISADVVIGPGPEGRGACVTALIRRTGNSANGEF